MKIGITLTSSLEVGQEYIKLTHKIAKQLAIHSHAIVYGGTAYGMMLELAETYKTAGGKNLIGVVAEDLMRVTKAYEVYSKLDKLYTTATMNERKDQIINESDAFLILPGGYGTIEELITVVGGKVNKIFDKPIAIYNYNGFYNKFILFFDELYKNRFSKINLKEIVLVSEDLDEILTYFESYKKTELADKFV